MMVKKSECIDRRELPIPDMAKVAREAYAWLERKMKHEKVMNRKHSHR